VPKQTEKLYLIKNLVPHEHRKGFLIIRKQSRKFKSR